MSAALRRLAPVAVVAALLCLVATGCRPEPAPTATASATATPSAPGATPSPSTAASPTATAEGLPASCEEAYSAAMLSSLQAQIPPLNDPGVTMLSTQVVGLLEILDSGAPTMRCSWGAPSEVGIATDITLLSPGQSEAIVSLLRGAGFGCEAYADGQLCSIEDKGITQDDQPYSHGEVHYVDEAHWVSTAWLNIVVDGYTADIVDHLWG